MLGFDFFLSRGLYKGARQGRVDFFRASDRWYMLVVGGVTLEITVPNWLDNFALAVAARRAKLGVAATAFTGGLMLPQLAIGEELHRTVLCLVTLMF